MRPEAHADNSADFCSVCGVDLAGTRAASTGTRFCSATCRSRAWRDPRRVLVGRALDVFRGDGTTDAYPDDPVRLTEYTRDHPGLVAAFGLPVLAAALRELPAWACRWCAADDIATEHGLDVPVPNAASRRLIGPPCERHRPDRSRTVRQTLTA